MSKNKWTKTLVAALAVVLASVCLLCAACVDKPQAQTVDNLSMPQLQQDEMAVIVKNGENDYTVVTVTLGSGGTDAQNGEQLLNYLSEQGVLTVSWKDGSWGKYIDGIGGAVAQGNEYIAIYTSVAVDQTSGAGTPSFVLDAENGVSVVYSNKGITTMTVESQAVFYFQVESYSA